MTYRKAADLLEQMFPVNAAKHFETVRRHVLKVGEALQERPVMTPETIAPAVVETLDSTFIRSCETGERHLEVRVGNVETKSGGRQVFGAVAKTETDLEALINRSLDAVGRTEETALTAFTDGCSGLRRIFADAGVTELPFLDWFHIGMRLQHLKQVAGALSCDDPSRAAAKEVIVGEVSACTGSCGTVKPPMPRSALIASAWSCTISRVGQVRESPSRHRENCGRLACD